MQPLTLEELDREADAFDGAVDATPHIDHFCSSTRWILPACKALMPQRTSWIFRGQCGHVAMMRGQHPHGWSYVEPLEAMWGLACPLLGPSSRELAQELADLCRARELDWDVMLLSGLPLGSPLFHALVRSLFGRYELFQGQITRRHVASLDGGVDGFLGRRTRNFRKSLRRAERAARDAAIAFEPCHAHDPASALALYERVLAIEARSWKGREGVGINDGPMSAFYRDMLPRLAARDELRILIARQDERDIAFVLGGVCGHTYRGLQFSFDAEYETLSLGNLCQLHQIAALCREGVAFYDLGTTMEYKLRWAESTHDSVALIVRKR